MNRNDERLDPRSVKRKGDREEMARLLTAAVLERGAEGCATYPIHRELSVEVRAPGGAWCHVDFDGDSTQPDVFVVTWNADRPLASTVGDVNTFHRRKATRVFYGFEALVCGVCADVECFADGSGYANEES